MLESAPPPRDPSDLIDASLRPPPPVELGAHKSVLRKLTLRLGRANARHEQQIDRELLRAIQVLRRHQAEIQPQLDELRAWLHAMRGGTGDALARVTEIETTLAQRLAALEAREARVESLVASDAPLHGGRSFQLETFDAGPVGTVVGFRAAGSETGSEGIYLGFEDYFRGSEEVVRERQRRYLPVLTGHSPVLDVGCGRGEFLELMVEAGIEACGIDVDPAMIAHCRAKGLAQVKLADAIGHLETLEEASLGTVFASHVIEHLPYEQLLRFLSLSLRKLRPGGLLAMETVNPHAPQAMKHFWIDPTHRHPLFPEVVIALCRLTGFASGFIWHPGGRGEPERDRVEQADFSVVATIPDVAT